MTQWGLDNLFNPGKRHMDDEKRRLQSTREEVGDASGGRRIDLEGGKVSIRIPRSAASEQTEQAEQSVELDPALEVDDVPAVALANDEAEIAPAVASDPADAADHADISGADVAQEPSPEEERPAAPRKHQVSASHWARRG